MKNIIVKKYLVFYLEIVRIFIFGIVLGAILIVNGNVNLFFIIYIPVASLFLILCVRYFFIYENKIEIVFLYRKIIIPFEVISKVVYDFRAAGGVVPVIIIKTKTNDNFSLGSFYRFLFYRFVLRRIKNVASILNILNNKIPIEFKTSPNIKAKIISKMGSNF